MEFCIADRDYPVKSGPIWTEGPALMRHLAVAMIAALGAGNIVQ
jgi:hypothetical protein